MDNKIYLGDGAYAELDQWGRVVLTTENGLAVMNRIVLEPQVREVLILWLKSKGIIADE